MPEVCPRCGEELEVVWGVTVGDSGDYRPVFGGPVSFDQARCNHCRLSFDRQSDGVWRQPG